MSNLKILSTGIVAIALSLATGCTPTTQQDKNISEIPSAVPVRSTESPSPTTSPTASPTTSPTPSGQNTLSSSDTKFIKEAADGGLAEVQLGKLASRRGASKAVKQFAQRMVQDHTRVNNQLRHLATKKGVKLPKTLSSENLQVKQGLSKLSGAKFDREYMNQMLKDHQKDASAFETEAQQGQDPDVKAFASQTLPIIQEHLQQAGSIVNSATPTNTPTPTTNTPTPKTTP